MKTQTMNQTYVAKKHGTQKTITKNFILFAFLLLACSSFQVKAQARLQYSYDNSGTTCDWTVNLYDNSFNLLFTFTMPPGGTLGNTCQAISAPVVYVEFVNSTLGSLGLNGSCTGGCTYAGPGMAAWSPNCGGANPTDQLDVAWIAATSCPTIPPLQKLTFTASP